jgi:uncharacterized protein (DUF302 family)
VVRFAELACRRHLVQPKCGEASKEAPVTYYFSKRLAAGFEDSVERTVEALKREGFGIITEIDVKDALKKKINVEFRKYRILGACNPSLAYEALKIEDKVGTMLPCNVIVQDAGGGQTEVAAIDPVASMQAIDDPRLKEVATRVRAQMSRVIESL